MAPVARSLVIRSVGRGVPFPPADHLELYLDARFLTGANGSAVDPWPDKSGHARNLPANLAGFASRPALLTTGTTSPTGAHVVQFQTVGSNVGPAFGATFGLTMPSLTLGQTAYVWFNGRTFPGGQEAMFFAGANLMMAAANPNLNPGNQPPGFRGVLGNTEWSAYDGNILPGTGVLSFVYAPPSDGSGRASVFFNGSQLAYFDDRGFGGVPNKWGPGPAAGATLQILVSDSNAFNGYPLNGEIGCVLWYSVAHDASTRSRIERTLRQIWG